MALQTSITLESGIELFNAYFKVTKVSLVLDLDYSFSSAEIEVSVFKDQQARNDKLHPVLVMNYSARGEEFSTFFAYDKLEDNSNIVRQSYFFLKTKSLFQGASDV